MKKLLLSLSLVLCSCLSWAQTKINGAYVDSLSMQGVPFATVALTPDGAPKPEQVVLTETDGSFSITTKKNGKYTLSIAMMGNRPVSIAISATGKTIALGNLMAVEESEKIEGVTVVATRPVVRNEVDRIAYDIENDPDAPIKTVLDMLRKTPLVYVDGRDEITVNGSSNFKIFINDRRTSMFDNDAAKVLKGMPAESVKSIEVITSPGAKYDAEGVGCIINLVMSKKTSMKGITATLRGEMVTHMYKSVGYNLTSKIGNLTLSSNAGFNLNNETSYFNYTRQNGRDKDAPRDGYFVTSPMNSDNPNGYGYLEMSYDIDTLNLVTASVNFYKGRYFQEIEPASVEYYENGVKLDPYNMQKYENENGWAGLSIDLGYEHKFNRKSSLVFMTHYSCTPGSYSNIDQFYTPLPGNVLPSSAYNVSSKQDNDSREFIAQTDYANSLTDQQRLEVGIKYVRRDNNSVSSSLYPALTADDTDEYLTSDVDQTQNIYAAYASYQAKLGRFSFKAGLRSETSDLDVSSRANTGNDTYGYTTTDLVPSLFTSYNVSDATTLKLSYSMRISRPSVSYLNPHVVETQPSVRQYGNPKLDSEHFHNVALNYNFNSQKFNLSMGFNYNFSRNGILRYSFSDPDEQGIVIQTYGNVGKINNMTLSTYARYALTASTSVMFNGSARYDHTQVSELGEKVDCLSGNAYVTVSQVLPFKVNLSIWGGGRTRREDFQCDYNANVFYGLDLSRSFFEDRLNVEFNCQNPFKKYMPWKSTQWSNDAVSIQDVKYHIRAARFAVSYRFGSLKAQVNRTSSSIDNSDLLTGDSNGGGMGK